MLMRFKESPEPPQPGCLAPGSENKVMHASRSGRRRSWRLTAVARASRISRASRCR
jgi:hypothetical protein